MSYSPYDSAASYGTYEEEQERAEREREELQRQLAAGSITPAQPAVASTAPYGQAGATVANAYRTNLGREASTQEVGSHLGYGRATAPQNVANATRNIAGSEEAQTYRAAQAAPTEQAAVPAQTGNHQATVQGILAKHGYGPEGMAAAEAELTAAGIGIQKDSGGRFRGRIKLPDGRLVDINHEADGGAHGDWWGNKRGDSWGWKDHGTHPTNGWSFDGAGGPRGAMPAAGNSPTSFEGIQSMVPTDTNFFNTLQARLQGILGGSQAFDRQALRDVLARR